MNVFVLKKSFFCKFKEFFISILFAVLLGLFLRFFVIEVYKVPSESMMPTLLPGDHIAVSKLSYIFGLKPKRGDLVVVKLENSKEFYVKRVIGLPNDAIKIENERIFVNGKELNKKHGTDITKYTYLNTGDIVYSESFNNGSMYNVLYNNVNNYNAKINKTHVNSERAYYLLGDNRANSIDSRLWGEISGKNIIGKVVFLWFSLEPKTRSIRWQRIGKL